MTRLCAVIGAVLLCGALGAAAQAKPGNTRQRAYTLRFHRVDRHGAAWTAGDWVLLGPDEVDGTSILRGTLTNERTGFSRRVVPPAGCMIAALGPTVLVFACSQPDAPVGIEPDQGGEVRWLDFSAGSPVAVGRYWLEAVLPVEMAHDLPTVEYVNLATGEVVPDPVQAGGTAYAALSDPGLIRHACSPIRLGSIDNDETSEPGALLFVGRIGLNFEGPAGDMRIQECGGRASRLVNTGVGWSQNGRVAMWSARFGELGGVLGSTGARFAVSYPRALGGPGGINALNLSTRTIYLRTWTGQVWAAALPRALR